MRLFTLAAVTIICCWQAAGATVRVSYDQGDWNRIYWLPGGAPQPGDTVIIASRVTGMPAMEFGGLIIRAQGSLVVESGKPTVTSLVNEGTLAIDAQATLRVAGNVRSTGLVVGDGIMQMIRNGSAISGGGALGNLLVSGAAGTRVHLDAPVTVASLALGADNQLLAGSHQLTVNGTYISASSFGFPGIIGGGAVVLNGAVEGSAIGDIVIGSAPGYRPSKLYPPPAVHGMLGDSGRSVRFASTRAIGFSTLVGDVHIDSGVVLRASGIGMQGWNRVVGSLNVKGTLAAGEEGYRWIIDGDLFNDGAIENCTVVMQGHSVVLRSDRGTWDPGISLIFYGDSGSELAVHGAITVSRLTIAPLSPSDSDVVMRAGGSVVKVRHDYISDMGRGCRIVTDTVVKLWGGANGIVEGDVLFEGFWGSPVGGRYGGAGAEVRFVVRKEIARPFQAFGTLGSDPNGHIMVGAPAAVMGRALLRGMVTLAGGQSLAIDGDSVGIANTVRGGGALHLMATATRLAASGSFMDSTIVEIGRPDRITTVRLARTLFASRIVIHPGSAILYNAGDSMYASRELRYALQYTGDFNSASAACNPLDPRPLTFFSGARSVFRFRGNSLGYGAADSVKQGEGYFVNFPAPAIVWHVGRVANLPMTVPIHAGWNLIGGASIPVDVSRIVVQGTTLLTNFLTAMGGATAVTTLQPGRGYWVNAAGAGTLTCYPEP